MDPDPRSPLKNPKVLRLLAIASGLVGLPTAVFIILYVLYGHK